ncbi:unnamed protein product [Ixodes pacificus]
MCAHDRLTQERIRSVHEAVVRGNLAEVRQVLTRKRFALSRDHLGASPLHLAVLHGHTDVLNYIVDKFPETLDGPDNEGRTPLHYAAVVMEAQNYFDILKKAGADDTIKDKMGHTPEFYVKNPKELTIRDLLESYQTTNDEEKSATADVWKRPPTPPEDAAEETPALQAQPDAPVVSEAKSVPASVPDQDKTTDQKQAPSKEPGKVQAPVEKPSAEVRQLAQSMLREGRTVEEGRYLTDAVGDVLSRGLLAVSKQRPADPVNFLVSWFKEQQNRSTKNDLPKPFIKKFKKNRSLKKAGFAQPFTEDVVDEDAEHYRDDHTKLKSPSEFLPFALSNCSLVRTLTSPYITLVKFKGDVRVLFTPQDEEGQTVLHFAASHSHSEGCFYALIRQGHVLLAERDGRYRTARDVAREASQRDNLLDLDQYVLDAFLERRSDLLRALAHQGYDQLLNAVDKHGRDVTSIVTQFEMTDMQSLMHELAYFFKARDELHAFVRNGYLEGLQNLIKKNAGLVTAKSQRGRCALHVAVLVENPEIIEHLIRAKRDAVHVADNMGRTPLHYAMAMPHVTTIGQILVQNGASRTARDVVSTSQSPYS